VENPNFAVLCARIFESDEGSKASLQGHFRPEMVEWAALKPDLAPEAPVNARRRRQCA
jgi:hypothetical protein